MKQDKLDAWAWNIDIRNPRALSADCTLPSLFQEGPHMVQSPKFGRFERRTRT